MDALEDHGDTEECFEDANPNWENECSTYGDEGTCDSYNHCYWENNDNTCQIDGPEVCFWDCDGICNWMGDDDTDPSDTDPLGFCAWVVDTINNSSCTSDCSSEINTDLDAHVIECQACLDSGDANSEECLAID